MNLFGWLKKNNDPGPSPEEVAPVAGLEDLSGPELTEFRVLENLENDLGVEIQDHELLLKALTLPETAPHHQKNQTKLEFYGDAVIDLIASEIVFQRALKTGFSENLCKDRDLLTRNATLKEFSRQYGISKALEDLGQQVDHDDSPDHPAKGALSNTFEAVVGAMALSEGYETARNFFFKVVGEAPLGQGYVQQQLAEALDPDGHRYLGSMDPNEFYFGHIAENPDLFDALFVDQPADETALNAQRHLRLLGVYGIKLSTVDQAYVEDSERRHGRSVMMLEGRAQELRSELSSARLGQSCLYVCADIKGHLVTKQKSLAALGMIQIDSGRDALLDGVRYVGSYDQPNEPRSPTSIHELVDPEFSTSDLGKHNFSELRENKYPFQADLENKLQAYVGNITYEYKEIGLDKHTGGHSCVVKLGRHKVGRGKGKSEEEALNDACCDALMNIEYGKVKLKMKQ